MALFAPEDKLALLSVFDKEGIVEFAQALVEMGWKLLASGGTAKKLTEADLKVVDVANLIGGEAILGHRVVTLSREVHAGLLALNNPEHQAEMAKHGIPYIGLVCVDMYPLEKAITDGKSQTEITEMTDIGGPGMLRSAAKGRRIVVCDPGDRQKVIEWMKTNKLKSKKRDYLAAKAEGIVASYCLTSARSISNGNVDGLVGRKFFPCKYGETPPQVPAGFYSTGSTDPLGIDKFKLITGADPSFNNTCDMDRLLQTMTHIVAGWEVNFGHIPYVAVAVKHGNPCGVGVADSPKKALKKMIDGDRRAILGGFVMINFKIDKSEAEILINYNIGDAKRRLLDGITCPEVTEEALKILKRKKAKCRVLTNPALASLDKNSLDTATRIRPIRGGFLAQPNFTFILDLKHPEMKKYGQATSEQEMDMILAWAIECTSNSNTIDIVNNGMLKGLGSGQQDRVGACKVACFRADESGHDIKGATAGSDSFFPFDDGPRALHTRGIKAIFTTSGSINDQQTIDFCLIKNIILYMLPDKIARGFFGH